MVDSRFTEQVDSLPDIVDSLPDIVDSLPDIVDSIPDFVDIFLKVLTTENTAACKCTAEPTLLCTRDIRNMEPAWEKVQGLKFQLSSRTYDLPNGGTKEVPCYVLTKTECLYIATKFNDDEELKD